MSTFAHANARGREVANDPTGLRDEYGLGARHVAFYGTSDDDPGAGHRADHDRFAPQRQIACHSYVALDTAQNLERAVAPYVAADHRGATDH